MAQWLGLGAFTAGVPGSIPGQGTKILQVDLCGQKAKRTKEEDLVSRGGWGVAWGQC